MFVVYLWKFQCLWKTAIIRTKTQKDTYWLALYTVYYCYLTGKYLHRFLYTQHVCAKEYRAIIFLWFYFYFMCINVFIMPMLLQSTRYYHLDSYNIDVIFSSCCCAAAAATVAIFPVYYIYFLCTETRFLLLYYRFFVLFVWILLLLSSMKFSLVYFVITRTIILCNETRVCVYAGKLYYFVVTDSA